MIHRVVSFKYRVCVGVSHLVTCFRFMKTEIQVVNMLRIF